jgi:hypothetical protein
VGSIPAGRAENPNTRKVKKMFRAMAAGLIFLTLNCAESNFNLRTTTAERQRQAAERKPDFTENELLYCTAKVSFETIPPVAEVFVNERFIGYSNVGPIRLYPGKYRVKFVCEQYVKEIDMAFAAGDNSSAVLDLR